MNYSVFGKPIENVKKHRDIKLVTTERRRNYLVSEPNYHTTKFFTENLLAIEMKKTEILMNKPVYLGLSILELSKILMYEFRYDYEKSNYHQIKIIKIILKIVLHGYKQFHSKQMIFIKTLQKMLKLNLIPQIMK